MHYINPVSWQYVALSADQQSCFPKLVIVFVVKRNETNLGIVAIIWQTDRASAAAAKSRNTIDCGLTGSWSRGPAEEGSPHRADSHVRLPFPFPKGPKVPISVARSKPPYNELSVNSYEIVSQ